MARQLQPGILLNGRCGLPGDFDTPEGHVTPSPEGRLWEAYLNLNDSGGYHRGDHNWKTPAQIAEVLRQCAAGQGNLMLNLAPKGDGSVPESWEQCVATVGSWLKRNREAVFTSRRYKFASSRRGAGRFHTARTIFGVGKCLLLAYSPLARQPAAAIRCGVRGDGCLHLGRWPAFGFPTGRAANNGPRVTRQPGSHSAGKRNQGEPYGSERANIFHFKAMP